jgi:hypothetical protein
MMTEHVIPQQHMIQQPPITRYVDQVVPRHVQIPRPNAQQVVRSFIDK